MAAIDPKWTLTADGVIDRFDRIAGVGKLLAERSIQAEDPLRD